MRRWLLPIMVVAAASLAVPQLAAADTASAQVKLHQSVITVGDPAVVKVNVHAKFSSVESVCFAFTFNNDLLDPGDVLRITPLELFPSLNGFATGGGSSPQSERTICVDSSAYSNITALFVDGRARDIELGMESGSVQIASLTVTVNGTLLRSP